MSRKPKKGYFVKGHFVAEGSELDLQLKREASGRNEVSRTNQKKESDALQALGEALVDLRPALLGRLDLPENLQVALAEAKRISDFEGRRRHMQYIGKLMRRLDDTVVEQAKTLLDEQFQGSREETLQLHLIEQWRTELLGQDSALEAWMTAYPQTDSQALRALIRQIRKDQQAALAKPGTATTNQAFAEGKAPRQSKGYRELFSFLKAALTKAQEVTQAKEAEQMPPNDAFPQNSLP